MRTLGEGPRDGDQLELDLFPEIPWGGRRPRDLTRGGCILIFKARAAGHEVYRDPLQMEIWPSEWATNSKGLWKYSGAPLLFGSFDEEV